MSVKKEIHEESWLKTIFKHGKWYLLSSLFSKGVGIFLLPIYTEYLSPEEYGILDSLRSVSLLLPIFISLYLDSAFGRYFHEYKYNKEKLRKLFSTIYWFVLSYGVLIVAITLTTSGLWMNDLLKVPVFPYAFLAFIPPLFAQLGSLGSVFLRQSLMSKKTTILEVTSVVVNLLVALPLLIIYDLGVIAKLWGNFATALLLFLFYTWYFAKNQILTFSFHLKTLKNALIYSIPLIPNIAGGWIAGLSDRLIIAKYVNLEAVGLYSIGYTLGGILYVLQNVITQVIGPISMSGLIKDKEQTKIKIAKSSLFLLAFMLVANLGIFLFSKEIIFIFADEKYSQAYYIIPIIGFTYVLSSQYRLFSAIISLHKKMWVVSSAGILQAIVNLGLNILLIPIFGYIVAAITTVISMIVYSSWIFLWAQKFDKININWRKTTFMVVIFVLCVVIGLNYVEMELSLTAILHKTVLFMLTCVVFYLSLKIDYKKLLIHVWNNGILFFRK